jgi:hypothetical protein
LIHLASSLPVKKCGSIIITFKKNDEGGEKKMVVLEGIGPSISSV